MKNIQGFGNIGSNMNDLQENRVIQSISIQPQNGMPAKPDKNPDPTRFRPGINDPEKVDPTRISEPEPADPTRIDDPTPMKPEEMPGELPTIW